MLGLSALATLFAVTPASAIEVQVNGRPVHFDYAQPTQIDGRVFIPLRNVAESLGAEVRWDAADRTVRGSRGDRTFTLPLDSHTAYVMGQPIHLDAPARITSGTTMVPLRFVGEALGADVAWRPDERLVALSLAGAETAIDTGRRGRNRDPDRDVNDRPRDRDIGDRVRDRPVDERRSRVSGDRQNAVAIPANTVVRVALNDAISSDTAREGERFSAKVSSSDRSRFPMGTELEGRITQVQRAAKDKPGIIDMTFDRAVLPDGTAVAISGGLASLDKESVDQGADGRLTSRKKDGSSKFDLKWIGYGAAGGAVLGQIFGGSLLKGALLGGLGGAVYSYLNKDKKREYRDVELSRGTEFGVRLDQRVAFSDRDSYRYE